MVLEPVNQPAWAELDDISPQTIFVEQGVLSACLEFHRREAEDLFADVSLECLFPSLEVALHPLHARNAGFTHLMGLAKIDQNVGRRLLARAERDYPTLTKRCVEYVAKTGQTAP